MSAPPEGPVGNTRAQPVTVQRATSLALEVNGQVRTVGRSARRTLADVLREELGLTGTHLGCEQGVCGACTVLLDGEPVRACLLLAVQAEGRSVRTVEGLAAADGTLHPVQQALLDASAFQCGFCSPGIVVALAALVDSGAPIDAASVRDELSGHLCRCTGYSAIVAAVVAGVTGSERRS